MGRGTAIGFMFGLFFVFSFSVIAYFVSLEKVRIPQEDTISRVSEVSLPSGVNVIEKEGKRILRDDRAHYEMVVPHGVSLKTEGERVLFQSSESDVPIVGGIRIFENKDDLSLDAWLADEHAKNFFLLYDKREKSRVGDVEMVKIPVEGEGEYFNYFFTNNSFVVGITLLGEEYAGAYVESIKIIK